MAETNERLIHGNRVVGKDLGDRTDCKHYHSQLDIVAIRFKCCDTYYPCYLCHEESSDHRAVVWRRSDFNEKAALCGVCGLEMAIRDYLACRSSCPQCKSPFNPACETHRSLYFEV